jgi:hypothetical protein
VDGAVGKLQDDDGEGQERERETEADQKEATKRTANENTNTDEVISLLKARRMLRNDQYKQLY